MQELHKDVQGFMIGCDKNMKGGVQRYVWIYRDVVQGCVYKDIQGYTVMYNWCTRIS